MISTIINDSSEWQKFFSNIDTDNYTSSTNYIKKLTTISVSCIMYLKDILPHRCFTEECIEGIKLSILNKTNNDNTARFLNAALGDAFDALDKKYLDKLALCFYEGDCSLGKLSESHVFSYAYTRERVAMDVSANLGPTLGSVRQQTADFVRASLVNGASCQKVFPSSAYGLRVRLYYNEVKLHTDAPTEYHAPGFVPDDDDDHIASSLDWLAVGRVETSFHALSVLSSGRGHALDVSNEAIPSQNPPMLSKHTEDLIADDAQDAQDRSASHGLRINCPCKKNRVTDRYAQEELLTCYYCDTQQHASCFGVFGDATRLSRHCCADCYDADPARSPTDQELVPLPPLKRACLCILRRTLRLCARRESVDAPALADAFPTSAGNALKLMKMLHRYGVVQPDPENDLNKPQKISQRHLKLALNKYSNIKEGNVVDRLIGEIEESLLTQESCQSNPIEDVLTPFAKNDLRQAFNFGRIIEKPEEKSVIGDPILEQYRQAIVEEEIEDPLPKAMATDEETTNKRKPGRIASAGVAKKKSRLQIKK